MLDDHLADLYQMETRRLNEQVKRNIDRFSEDFNVPVDRSRRLEVEKCDIKLGWDRRKIPFGFTEHGVLMLSSVLNSDPNRTHKQDWV